MGNSNRKEAYSYERNQPKNVDKITLEPMKENYCGGSRGVDLSGENLPEGTYFSPARPPTAGERKVWSGVL